jgi:hypothetical protein
MKRPTKAAYERSRYDVEKKGVKEGSKADKASDKKGMARMMKAKGAKR